MFAKLFGTPEDQILVMLDTNDEGHPAVHVLFEPPGYGVCKLVSGFQDTEDNSEAAVNAAWDQAQEVFDKYDEALAREATTPMRKVLGVVMDEALQVSSVAPINPDAYTAMLNFMRELDNRDPDEQKDCVGDWSDAAGEILRSFGLGS